MENKELEEFLKEEYNTEVSEEVSTETRTIELCKKILTIELEKKALNDDIKAIKDELKSLGVKPAVVTKAINAIKAELKTSKDEAFEFDRIIEDIKNDNTLMSKIEELI